MTKPSTAQFNRRAAAIASVMSVLSVGIVLAAGTKIAVTGDQQVPAVTTSANGSAVIKVAEDKSVSGTVITKDMVGTAAHIHLAAPGKNGPPVIGLIKKSETVWSVPAGSRLTDAWYESYKQGELYVNVHSAEHKGGEIRGQLQP